MAQWSGCSLLLQKGRVWFPHLLWLTNAPTTAPGDLALISVLCRNPHMYCTYVYLVLHIRVLRNTHTYKIINNLIKTTKIKSV